MYQVGDEVMMQEPEGYSVMIPMKEVTVSICESETGWFLVTGKDGRGVWRHGGSLRPRNLHRVEHDVAKGRARRRMEAS